MSGFLELTPVVEIVLKSPLTRKKYPLESSVVAIVDTGYEGFLAVPNSVFRGLELNRFESEKRKVALADGTISDAEGSYATLRIPHLSLEVDGFVETFSGLDEIILGVQALGELKVLLDYCNKKVKIEKCS